MKKIALVLIVILSSHAWSGDKIGSGGGLWTCQINGQARVDHGMLIDLYEAKEEYSLDPIVAEGNPDSIVAERAIYLQTNLPEYFQILKPFLDEVKEKVHYVDAVIRPIEDSLYHIIPLPKYCANGVWSYTQFANFTDQGLVLVQKDLWENPVIPNLDKGALIWHEAVYRWLRIAKGDTNSIRARQIVGILFSNLNATGMRERIAAVMGAELPSKLPWICLSQDLSSTLVYSGQGALRREAELASLRLCAGAHHGPCLESTLRCDQIESGEPRHFCETKNFATGDIYSARGNSTVAATYNTLQSCYAGPSSFGQCLIDRVTCQ